MASEVSASLRQLVADRAAHRCEYCLLPQLELILPVDRRAEPAG